MRKLILLLILLPAGFMWAATPAPQYAYYKPITIDHTKVPSTQTDFPVLISLTHSDFKGINSGGHVYSATGLDIAFYSDTNGTVLQWEIERYTATTGEVIAWVKIPSLSSSSDTVIYVYYGNPTVTSAVNTPANVWTNSFLEVWHYKDGTTLSFAESSGAGSAQNPTNAPTAATGQVDGAMGLASASSQHAETGGSVSGTNALTYSAWVKATSFPSTYAFILNKSFSGTNYISLGVKSSNSKMYYQVLATTDRSSDGVGTATLSTGTWYYVTMTYDSTNGLIGYVNATQDATVSANGNASATAAAIATGYERFSSGKLWNGTVDEARVATVARSADWITTEYNNQSSPSTFETLGSETLTGATFFTEFYCNASTGSNLNGGSDAGSVTYTSTNGNWNGTTTFTPTDGSNPVSSGVAAGQFASIYLDGATTTVSVSRITSVTNSANGPIVVSTTARGGLVPTSGATGRTIKVGGAWKGPNGTDGFPFVLGSATLASATNVFNAQVRVNLKNNATYSPTASLTSSGHLVIWQGYGTTVGDRGRATIDWGGNNVNPMLAANSGGKYVDLIFSNVGVSAGTGIGVALSTANSMHRCAVHDVRGTAISMGVSAPCMVDECEVYAFNKSNTAGQAGIDSSGGILSGNYIHSAPGSNVVGIRTAAGTSAFLITNNVIFGMGKDGISISSSNANSLMDYIISNNDLYNNGGAGIKVENLNGNYYLIIQNNNFIKNGTYAFDGGTSATRLDGFMYNNGYGSGTQANTLGNYNAFGTLILDDSFGTNSRVIYPSGVTPYSDPANGNFSLVNTSTHAGYNAGRGAYTQTDGSNSNTVGYPDIGAAQHNDSCSGTGPCQTSGASAQ